MDVIRSVVTSLNIYRKPNEVVDHICQLLAAGASMSCKECSIGVAENRTQVVVGLDGTFPISYDTRQFNIPAGIFLLDAYPNVAPLVFILPTKTMALKPSHRHVDRTGRVYMPYLSEWSPATHNLVGVYAALTKAFNNDTPVFATPIQPSQSIQPTANPMMMAQPRPVALNSSNSSANFNSSQQSSKSFASAELNRKMQHSLSDFYSTCRESIDDEFKSSQMMEANQKSLESYSAELNAKCRQLRDRLVVTSKMNNDVNIWVSSQVSNSPTAEFTPQVLAQRLAPSDLGSEQLINVLSEHQAIEEAVELLDRLLANNKIELVAFLREVRRLGQRQFLVKAHAMAIMRAQRFAMA